MLNKRTIMGLLAIVALAAVVYFGADTSMQDQVTEGGWVPGKAAVTTCEMVCRETGRGATPHDSEGCVNTMHVEAKWTTPDNHTIILHYSTPQHACSEFDATHEIDVRYQPVSVGGVWEVKTGFDWEQEQRNGRFLNRLMARLRKFAAQP